MSIKRERTKFELANMILPYHQPQSLLFYKLYKPRRPVNYISHIRNKFNLQKRKGGFVEPSFSIAYANMKRGGGVNAI